MAQQDGPLYITGTIDNLCFYEMEGKYYVRIKSSLTGQRVKRDPAFRRTRENADLLGKASRLASGVYRRLPAEQRKRSCYRQMTGKALRLLHSGKPVEEVLTYLEQEFLGMKDEVISSTAVPPSPAKPRLKIILPLKRPWQRGLPSGRGRRYHRSPIFYSVITGFPVYDLKGPPGEALNEFIVSYY